MGEDKQQDFVRMELSEIKSRLKDYHETLISLDKRIAVFNESAKNCRAKCDATHKAVFGNGGPGIRAKVWAIYGVIGALWSAFAAAFVAIVKGWVGS